MNSPTSRSLAKLRKEGWLVAVVERWNQYAKVRQDLFGFIDLIAIKGDITLAVQSTSGANVSARIAKIQGSQAASVWLESPMRKIVVHGWRKVGARGARKLWECREVPLVKPLLELNFVEMPLPEGTPFCVPTTNQIGGLKPFPVLAA